MSTPHRMMRVLPIKTNDDGLFGFDSHGELAIVADVIDSEGDPADLVAWQPERPGRWWLRFGDVAVLGSHELAVAAWGGGVIRLHGTPEEWFRGGRHGTCVLLWDAPLDHLFAGVEHVDVDGVDHHHRLVNALRRWEPHVTVPEARHAA